MGDDSFRLVGAGSSGLQWHEAVAITHAIAGSLAQGSLTAVPPATSIGVDERGTVCVRRSPDASTAASGSTAARLAELFRQLVGTNAVPSALDAALRRAVDGAETDSPTAFCDAIGMFVRPSREADLLALAARLRAFQEETRVHSEVEALTRKARAVEQKPAEQAGTVPLGQRRSRRNWRVAAGIAATLVLALIIFALLSGRQSVSVNPIVSGGRALLHQAGALTKSLVGSADRESAPVPAGRVPATAAAGARPLRQKVQSRANPAAPEQLTAARASLSWILSLPPGASTHVPVAAVSEAAAKSLYDSNDEDVSPALLVRPRLPALPGGGAPPEHIGRLEVIVSSTGEVERVRLLATTSQRRYYDSMLLPAVKAWVFTPARRNGVAVRYRLEIPLVN